MKTDASGPTIYEELGVRTVINAVGPFTRYGGSLMPPEVVRAMGEAAQAFVDIDELLDKAGCRIAQLVGVPAAFVTGGAAAALAVSAAACMAGADPVKAMQLPDTRGLKDEIIMLRVHRIHYDQALRVAGARIVDAGFTDWSSVGDLEAVLTERTAGVLYVAKSESMAGSIPLHDVLAFARRHEVPVVVDAADELPPASNLHRFVAEGADAALYSGGKDLRGPQSSGLIVGTKDFVEACRVHACPHYGVGRPMKAGKEEIAGLVKAVERYVQGDTDAYVRCLRQAVAYFREAFASLPHVHVDADPTPIPGEPGSYRLPSLQLKVDGGALSITGAELARRLFECDPRIVVGVAPSGIVLRPQMLEEHELPIVVARVREALTV